MKILGIDYGTVRIGLAVGDTEVLLAFPIGTVQNIDGVIATIVEKAKEEGVSRIVLGVPRRLSGEDEKGETEEHVDHFLKGLREKTDIEIDTEDERLTTVIAERRRMDTGTKKKKFDLDSEAAVVLLETYMQRIV